MIPALVVARCVLAAAPVLATAQVGDRAATLTPNAVRLGDRVASACDTLPAPHPIAIARWGDQLAIGFRDGGVWAWDGAAFAAVPGLPTAPVRALAGVGATLWVGTADGLWSAAPEGPATRLDHPVLGHAAIAALTALPGDAGVDVAVDPRGAWRITGEQATVVDRRALIGCYAGGAARPPGGCARGAADVPIHVTALAAFRGRLLVGTFDDGVWARTPTGFARVPSPALIDALLVDGDGVWAASATGLYRMTDDRGFTRVDLGLPSTHVNDLARAGDTLWLATSRGLAAWDGARVRLLDPGPARVVYAVAVAADGAVWAGTIGGAIRFGADGTRRLTRASGALPADWVTALLPEPDGGVLIGTYDAGVVRAAADGSATAVAELAGRWWVNPHGLARLGGALAAATLGQGLRVPGGALAHLPDTDVTAVLALGDRTWVGTRGGLAELVAR